MPGPCFMDHVRFSIATTIQCSESAPATAELSSPCISLETHLRDAQRHHPSSYLPHSCLYLLCLSSFAFCLHHHGQSTRLLSHNPTDSHHGKRVDIFCRIQGGCSRGDIVWDSQFLMFFSSSICRLALSLSLHILAFLVLGRTHEHHHRVRCITTIS